MIANDFRIPLPLAAAPRPFRLSWSFVLAEGGGADVGFSVVERLPNGSLPQLVPYSRAPRARGGAHEGSFVVAAGSSSSSSESECIVLFDNSYSLFRPKALKYRLQVEPLPLRRLVAEEAEGTSSSSSSSLSSSLSSSSSSSLPPVLEDAALCPPPVNDTEDGGLEDDEDRVGVRVCLLDLDRLLDAAKEAASLV